MQHKIKYSKGVNLEVLYVIILGIVQGLTEFLPVSSSGHLVMLNSIFNINGNFVFLSVLLHFATLLSVIIVFKKQICYLIKNPFCSQAKKLYLATLPTVVLVLVFKSFFMDAFDGRYLPFCFMVTAVLIILTNIFAKTKQNRAEISYKSAFLMGTIQAIAVLPGISRSGSTICAGLFMGEDKKQATEFSFLMSIPIIIASLIFEVYDMLTYGASVYSVNIPATILGFIFALITGIFAIKIMLKTVQNNKFIIFAIYLIILSVVCLALL